VKVKFLLLVMAWLTSAYALCTHCRILSILLLLLQT